MKKLILIAFIAISALSCKKDESAARVSGLYDVSFVFNPTGNPSEITFKNLQTGEVKTYSKQTSTITINNQVKAGDKFSLEMTGKADGLDDEYSIRVFYKNGRIAGVRAFGSAGKQDQSLKLDKTFTLEDFN